MYGFTGIFDLKKGSFQEACDYFHLKGKKDIPLHRITEFSTGEIFISQFSDNQRSTTVFESESLYIAGRCRIDNLEELYSELELTLPVGDLQLIGLACEKWPKTFPEHLIGDFSFVIWHKQKKKLILAKDQLGIRPLFYMVHDGLLYFSSSVPLLKNALPLKPALNVEYIANELSKYQQEVEDTFFEEIKRLKPAHYLMAQSGTEPEINQYWELEAVDLSHCRSDDDYYRVLRESLYEAVRCRIRGKTTVGCQLSGGMDSSAIAVILSRIMDKNDLHTYSFVLNEETKTWTEKGIDEQATQEAILSYADLNRNNHHPIENFHYRDVFHELEVRNEVMGGLANSDCIWQDTLFKTASEVGVEVMFSGFPGDEGISNSGSFYYYEYIFQRDYRGLLSHISHFRLRGLYSFLKYFRNKLSGTTKKGFDKIRASRSILASDSPVTSRQEKPAFAFYPSYREWMKGRMCRPHSTLRTESEGAYALQYDIETVYPLADIRLLALVYSLPVHLFRPKPYTRALFRNLCRDILPDKVRLQPKRSGAKTLAFADYWIHDKHKQLKSYTIKNHTGMLTNEADLAQKLAESDFSEAKRQVRLKEADYLIGLNWPEEQGQSNGGIPDEPPDTGKEGLPGLTEWHNLNMTSDDM